MYAVSVLFGVHVYRYVMCMYIIMYHMCIYLLLTVVNCGNLTNPVNGQLSHTAGTTFGQTGTYRCNTGYNLVGDNTRICLATGVWSGSAPTCQGMLLHATVSQ